MNPKEFEKQVSKWDKSFDYCFDLFLKEMNFQKRLLRLGDVISHLLFRKIGWLVSLLLKLFHR